MDNMDSDDVNKGKVYYNNNFNICLYNKLSIIKIFRLQKMCYELNTGYEIICFNCVNLIDKCTCDKNGKENTCSKAI